MANSNVVRSRLAPQQTREAPFERAAGPGPTAGIRSLGLPLEALHRRGIDSAPLLRAFRLPVPSECEESLRIGQRVLFDFWDACAIASRDPAFGLRIAVEYLERAVPSIPPVLRQLTRHSQTLGEAIEHVLRYERLCQEGRTGSLTVEGDRAVWMWTAVDGARFSRAYSEQVLAYFSRPDHWANRNADEVELLEVHFPLEAPSAREEFDAHFKVPLFFNCGYAGLVFSRSSLDARATHADPTLVPLLARLADHDLGSVPSTARFADRVRAQLARGGDELNMSARGIARRLGTAERTLRRRLAEENTSLSELVDEWRRTRARQLVLRGEHSMAEIAAALGYSEQNTLARAYRRWFGTSPGADRRELRSRTGSIPAPIHRRISPRASF